MTAKRRSPGKAAPAAAEPVWLDPTGGLGDVVMLSSVLKLACDRDPSKRFNLVRRTQYVSFLRNHPAIARIGLPPQGVETLVTNYWVKGQLGPGRGRAFQLLAELVGLETPVEEQIYLPERIDEDPWLHRYLPLGKGRTIVIAPFSQSPRKMMALELWEHTIELLAARGFSVLQAGGRGDILVKGAYSVLGLTNPPQLALLLQKVCAVVTVDNFVMHCAADTKTPTVVLWGPTDPDVYGYAQHLHLRADLAGCPERRNCIGPDHPQNYSTACPIGPGHCMNRFVPAQIVYEVDSLAATPRGDDVGRQG